MGMENNSIAEPYSSHPIPVATKCIRVLDVHAPSSSQPDGGPVQGSLRVIDLDQEPIFSALSYVWGPFSTPPKTIPCESVAVPVSDSCYSALTYLRRKLGGFTIWIDAICINQTFVAEKQLQIPLMGDIYDRATRVFVWLREGTSATDRAMIYIRTCGLLEYFFADGVPTGAELQAPRSWRAFFSTYFSRWSFKTYFNPFIKDGKSSCKTAYYTEL
jgi:Heterokaryon incompatibility protein (HET)